MAKSKKNIQIVKKYALYSAILSLAKPDVTVPVVVIQTDLLNLTHISTVICLMTRDIQKIELATRVKVSAGVGNQLDADFAIALDQVYTLNTQQLIQPLGQLTESEKDELNQKLKYLLIDDF